MDLFHQNSLVPLNTVVINIVFNFVIDYAYFCNVTLCLALAIQTERSVDALHAIGWDDDDDNNNLKNHIRSPRYADWGDEEISHSHSIAGHKKVKAHRPMSESTNRREISLNEKKRQANYKPPHTPLSPRTEDLVSDRISRLHQSESEFFLN